LKIRGGQAVKARLDDEVAAAGSRNHFGATRAYFSCRARKGDGNDRGWTRGLGIIRDTRDEPRAWPSTSREECSPRVPLARSSKGAKERGWNWGRAIVSAFRPFTPAITRFRASKRYCLLKRSRVFRPAGSRAKKRESVCYVQS